MHYMNQVQHKIMWDKIIPLEENQQEKIDLSNAASTGENVKHQS